MRKDETDWAVPAGSRPRIETAASSRPGNLAGATRLRTRLGGLSGWRRMAVAGGLGALAAAALPPTYVLPLLIPAFAGLFWMVDDSPGPGKAFWDGWWFGFGHSVAGLYWIFLAFVVDAPRYGWMAPFAVAGMAAGMAFFPAAAALLTRWAFAKGSMDPVGRILVFATLWTAGEWARGEVFTGFPWNLIGTVWTVSDAMIQLAALTGVYGLSLLTVAVAAMPAVLAEKGEDMAARAGSRPRTAPVVVVFLVLAGVWAGGQARLSVAGNETVPGVRLRLVQPNIPQDLKWRPQLRRKHVVEQLRLSAKPSKPGHAPTHIIWAETAVPFFLSGNEGLISALAGAAPADGLIIVGAPRKTPASKRPGKVWNSLQAIDSKGRIKGTYDKFHLVPFGEYVPFRDFLNIGKLTAGRKDFSPGPGVRTLDLNGLPPVSPLICFEAIFPGQVAATLNRPHWLLNLTNDAWFGQSSGPYQHFAAARLRAVEEGLPLVRVANTGISGVIDPYGRTLQRLGLGLAGVVDSPLPTHLRMGTPFGRLGHWLTGLILIMALGAGFLLTGKDSTE